MFAGEAGKSIIKDMARNQIKCGHLGNDEYLKMKYFLVLYLEYLHMVYNYGASFNTKLRQLRNHLSWTI